MDRVIFENVRCFRGRHEAPLRPLTVLVGENSSGKTTFLALVRLAWDVAWLQRSDFNEEPFTLGAFEQIASFRKERRVGEFAVGAMSRSSLREASEDVAVSAVFASGEGQPVRRQWELRRDKIRLEVRGRRIALSAPSGEIAVEAVEPEWETEWESDWKPEWENLHASLRLAKMAAAEVLGFEKTGTGVSDEDWTAFLNMLDDAQAARGPRPYAFAPVRTRPRRTYDPVKDTPDPEGAHVPMILRGAFAGGNGGLAESLVSFGRASGLFDSVEIRRLGESSSDPFQIQIRLDGSAVNLVDVGYGVSQVLPIIVDCVRGKEGGTFLLQQPEVHLHPKAQAELATFLGTLAKAQRKRFVIETHSDYLVDRIRMDLRDGRLEPEDVALLYFERVDGEARIHHLELDEQGNFLDVPPGYRSFFLEEARRFLGS